MFYVKEENDNCAVKVELRHENVYSNCRKCGKEVQIFPSSLIYNGELDLDATVLCEDCSGR